MSDEELEAVVGGNTEDLLTGVAIGLGGAIVVSVVAAVAAA